MSTSHCRAKLGNKRVRAALFMDRITSSNLTLPHTAAGKLSKSVLHGIGPCSRQQRARVFCSASYGRSSSIGASMKRGFYHSCTATEFLGKNLACKPMYGKESTRASLGQLNMYLSPTGTATGVSRCSSCMGRYNVSKSPCTARFSRAARLLLLLRKVGAALFWKELRAAFAWKISCMSIS
jgi:hypothetical protein